MVDLFRKRKWDLVGHRKVWFAISLAVILTGMYFWHARGLNYGIDFTGGGLVTYQLAEPVAAGREAPTLAQAREATEKAGVDARLQIAGTATHKDQLLVRTRVVADESRSESDILEEQKAKLSESLSAVFPGITDVQSELVTPVVSTELMQKAVWAVAWGCLFILFWIRVRYLDFKWAGSALLALVHDVLVLLGVFAVTQREINSPFVAAALTVVGYSVHDTIVLFDRIRENLKLRKGDTFGETANISLLETMARSVNTVLTVLFVLTAVYALGGVSLRDFTFALLVGITAGGYSSIFTAAQILVVLKNREERAIARRRAEPRGPARAGAAARRTAPAVSQGARARPVREPAERPGRVTPTQPAPEAAAVGGEATGNGAEQKRRRARSARKKLKTGRKRKKRF
ncbi:MAG: protein translocase subunit SecF [Armatimonadota bacterium]|nr:MAG: protein translocase subunit SecF [Armatimonadota bacterium]